MHRGIKFVHYTDRKILFAEVRMAFRNVNIFSNPLNTPIDGIEGILRKTGYLIPGEHLAQYDTIKEAFPIIVFSDEDSKLGWFDSLRFKLVKLILPHG